MDGLNATVTNPLPARTGRCPNEFYCELASEGARIRVESGARFICPECGRPLVAVARPAPARRFPLALVLLSVLSFAAAGVGIYHGLSRKPSPPSVLSLPSIISLPSRILLTTEILPTRQLAPVSRETVMNVITAPVPAKWTGSQPPKPTRRETPKAGPPARKRKDRSPPAPVQPGKTNAWIRAGGMPPYPDDLPDGIISVTVHVDCLIGTDGAPSDCQVTGDAPFRRAVQRWLASGKVRFAPVLRKGVPSAIRQSWDVQFEGDD